MYSLISSVAVGQKFTNLSAVMKPGKLKQGQAIIYGSFVQRLGFTSGGFGQYIFLKNVESQKIYRFSVKPTFKSAKENTFIYHVPPGTYVIHQYVWTKSKWYGGETYVEPIVKEQPADSLLRYYVLNLMPDKVSYVGTWNFASEKPEFINSKHDLDERIQKKYKKLEFSASAIAIPE